MTAQELAYTEIESLVTNFKSMPASQRKGLNEMQTRLGYILPLFKAPGWIFHFVLAMYPTSSLKQKFLREDAGTTKGESVRAV